MSDYIEALQEEIRQLKRPRTVTLYGIDGAAIMQSVWQADQRFLWQSDVPIVLPVVGLEIR